MAGLKYIFSVLVTASLFCPIVSQIYEVMKLIPFFLVCPLCHKDTAFFGWTFSGLKCIIVCSLHGDEVCRWTGHLQFPFLNGISC